MRTCMEGCQPLQPGELRGDASEFQVAYVVVSGYSLHSNGLADRVLQLTQQVGRGVDGSQC
jgi:hypothetical protein